MHDRRFSKPVPQVGAILLLSLAASCSTNIGSGSGSRSGSPAPGVKAPGSTSTNPDPATTPTLPEAVPGTPVVTPPGAMQIPVTPATGPARGVLRLLTNAEYRSTVQDLLGLEALPADPLQLESRSDGYNNFSDALTVSPTLSGQYAALAKRVAQEIPDPTALAPCTPASAPTDCALSFARDFGKRAFRRPLTDAEAQAAVALFSGELPRTNYAAGIRLIVQAFLQSPYLLYRFELGTPAGPTRLLSPFEVATELSYMLSGSTPDTELLAAAEANSLSPTLVEVQARRLLATPRARDSVLSLMQQWLHLQGINSLSKDPAVYPELTPELWSAMAEETTRFVNAVVWDGDGSLRSLMSSQDSFMNATLAPLYGVPVGKLGADFMPQRLPLAERAGLLTQASVMAVHAKPNESNPITRGKFVRERLLCQPLLPPPPNLMVQPLKADPTRTARERFVAHSSNPACAGCHTLIDPLGLGLENYDGIGRFRSRENGKPVDATGNFASTRDIDGPFAGGVAMAQKLAASTEAADCFALEAMQWTFGRATLGSTTDRAIATSITTKLAPNGVNVRELLVEITKSDAFTQRSAQP